MPLNINIQLCTTSADLVRNIFLKQPFNTNSSELNCLLLIGHASRPYNSTGRDLTFNSSTSSYFISHKQRHVVCVHLANVIDTAMWQARPPPERLADQISVETRELRVFHTNLHSTPPLILIVLSMLDLKHTISDGDVARLEKGWGGVLHIVVPAPPRLRLSDMRLADALVKFLCGSESECVSRFTFPLPLTLTIMLISLF